MDWVLLCSIFILIAGFIIDIIKSFKDGKSSSDEHKNLSDEHNSISQKVKEQREFLEKDTQQIISQNSKQSEKIDSMSHQISDLDKMIYGEIQKRDIQFQNLSLRQQDAYKQVETYNFLFDEVKRLQTENNSLKAEINFLKSENQNLNQIIQNYKSQHRKNTMHR